MPTYFQEHKKISIAAGTLFVVAAIGLYALQRGGHIPSLPSSLGVAVEEKLIMPDVTAIASHEGRTVAPGAYTAPIAPSAETAVHSAQAVFTVKEAYTPALAAATAWSSDSKLVSIQSLGVITKEGKSGEWDVLFGSAGKKAGYEVVLYGGQIASQKEVASKVYGHDIPSSWYDSSDALISLRSQPQFEAATVSALNFFYNEDGKRWGYALATSKGTVSMPVK